MQSIVYTKEMVENELQVKAPVFLRFFFHLYVGILFIIFLTF